jgi:hypothetical protein
LHGCLKQKQFDCIKLIHVFASRFLAKQSLFLFLIEQITDLAEMLQPDGFSMTGVCAQ